MSTGFTGFRVGRNARGNYVHMGRGGLYYRAALHEAFDGLARSGGVWHVGAEGAVRDGKYHAGASHLVRRQAIRPAERAPQGLAVNVPVFDVPVGRQHLHFFPDRVLVLDGKDVGAVLYSALRIEVSETNFIEAGGLPGDAKVVGKTWRYVNKSGGPDRRFKDNREIPIARYEEIHFRSQTGLNEVIQCSRLGTGAAVRRAVADMATSMPSVVAQGT